MNVGPVVNVGGGNSGCGCLSALLGLVLAALLVSVLYAAIGSCSSSGYGYGYDEPYYSSSAATGAGASSTVRTKLDAGDVSKTGWHTDEDGDWIHSPGLLTPGLQSFYDQTGVQPYVYILKNGSETSTDALNERSQELYDELFSDEGHFLLVFCDDGDGGYNCGYTAGAKASTVMDAEAVGILQTQLNRAYNMADTDEEVFSEAFANTAEAIMAGARAEQQDELTGTIVAVVVAVAVVGGVTYLIVRKRKKDKAERQKRAEQILNTPLDTFGDKDVEDLASKYEDKDGKK